MQNCLKMKLYKYQGAGNDFLIADNRDGSIELDPRQIADICDRRYGVGADGLMLLENSPEYDFRMVYYNSDGSGGMMCGNGVRCVGKYVYDNLLEDKSRDTITIETLSGIKTLKITAVNGKAELLEVDMGKAILNAADIPVVYDGCDTVIAKPLVVDNKEHIVTCVSMGNPHCIVFVEDTKNFPLEEVGPLFESHEVFPNRVNAEFVQILDRKTVNMRVWERGSGETLACGTGTCATVVASCLNGHTEDEVTVHLLGGDLFIKWDREENLVYMTGPAKVVFDGEIEL